MSSERSFLAGAATAPQNEGRAGLTLAERGYRMLAPVYDFVFGESLNPGRRLAIRLLDARPGDRVLEVCVGTGLSLPLYPAKARVTGIDLSGDMLQPAAGRTARRRLSQVDSLLEMDAQHLAFPDAAFDKVSIMYALSGLPDPVRAVREMRRVCRPGGTIVIVDHFRSNEPLLRLCEQMLSPFYRLLSHRTDLALAPLLQATGLDPVGFHRANLFGYNTLIVWKNPK